MVFVGSHGEENFVSDFAIDIGCIIGISYDEGGMKLLGFHVILFNQFPVDETSIGTTVDKGVFLDTVLPLCDLNSIGMVKAYLLGFVVRIEKRSPG